MKKRCECEVCHKIYDDEDECLACESKHDKEAKAEENQVKYYKDVLTEIFNKIELYKDGLKEEYKNLHETLADMEDVLPNYTYSYKRKNNEKPEITLQKTKYNTIENLCGLSTGDWNDSFTKITSFMKDLF